MNYTTMKYEFVITPRSVAVTKPLRLNVNKAADPVKFTKLSGMLLAEDETGLDKFFADASASAETIKAVSSIGSESEGLDAALIERYQDAIGAGKDTKPIVAFIERLKNNRWGVKNTNISEFLIRYRVPLLEDGRMLLAKSVREDHTDHHTGTILNEIGKEVRIPDVSVDSNPYAACSNGLHVAVLGYIKQVFAKGVILKVAVCPSDVAAVPFDYDCQKIRCAGYEVLGYLVNKTEVDPEQPPVVKADHSVEMGHGFFHMETLTEVGLNGRKNAAVGWHDPRAKCAILFDATQEGAVTEQAVKRAAGWVYLGKSKCGKAGVDVSEHLKVICGSGPYTTELVEQGGAKWFIVRAAS